MLWNAQLPNKQYDLSRLNNCQTFKDSKPAENSHEAKVDIYKCIEQFEMKETLGEDNAWYCSKCKKHQKANKKMQIYKAPPILICHLKRFKYNQSSLGYHAYGNSVGKINQLIDCPHTLDMSNYVLNNKLPNEKGEPDDSKLMYELYAISNHYGNAGGGHYTAYAKNAHLDQWYEFDDSRVTPTDKDSVVTEAAYFLFYQRIS